MQSVQFIHTLHDTGTQHLDSTSGRFLFRMLEDKAHLSFQGCPLFGQYFHGFQLHCGTFYSFWVSKDANGKSGGYLAAGGPAYTGLRDL